MFSPKIKKILLFNFFSQTQIQAPRLLLYLCCLLFKL